MNKVIVFSDLHIHTYKNFNVGTSRMDNCISVLYRIFQDANALGIKHILFAGDLIDVQANPPMSVLTATLGAFADLGEMYPEIQFIAITGNHDHDSKSLVSNTPNSFAQILSYLPNFTLLDFKSMDLGFCKVTGIPFMSYAQDYYEIAEKCPKGKDHILLCHQTPLGVGLAHDIDPKDGFHKSFDMVFCGHIHQKAILSSNFVVLGSPIHRDRGDIGQDTGYYIYEVGGYVFDNLQFVSLCDEFPVFTYDADKARDIDYLIKVAEPEKEIMDTLYETKFPTDLPKADMLKNWWEIKDGKDTTLLNAVSKII